MSYKNLIMKVLFLLAIIFVTSANCARLPRSAAGFAPRSELDTVATPKNSTTPSVSETFSTENIQILDKAQFEASGLTLSTPSQLPTADEPHGWIKCETSGGSPQIDHVKGLYGLLFAFSNYYCCNRNTHGGGCSHLLTVGEASCAMCGRQECFMCNIVAANLQYIAQICEQKGRAGGVSYFPQGTHVVLY